MVTIDATYSLIYGKFMQYIGCCLNFNFLPVASNDNDDLLALTFPSFDLALVRDIKYALKEENTKSGVLLSSRKERRFFQEVLDAERYIMLRYFTVGAPQDVLRSLKRRILDSYLFPRRCKNKSK